MQEWWPIFCANLGGFLLARAISYVISFALSLLVQVALLTVVLICLLPLVFPASGIYRMLVMYTAFAQSYQEGGNRVAAQSIVAPA